MSGATEDAKAAMLEHKLQPIDEYGRLDTQCHGNADCDAGHRHPCVLDAEHEGPHSARKP